MSDDVRAVLPPLLGRLYARLRARGLAAEAAQETAAAMAAEMLACDVQLAREVMAALPVRGRGRSL